jgi:FlaG protein
MSDSREYPVAPVAPVSNTPAIQPVRPEPPVQLPAERTSATHKQAPAAAASTGGNLPKSYAQFAVDADTHEVVIRIHDAITDQVLVQYPSQQVEEIAAYMNNYAKTLARHHAAQLKGPTN